MMPSGTQLQSSERPAAQGDGHSTYRRILVAVDDSPAARWAQDAAARLARALGARLALVHVAGVQFNFPAEWNYVEDELRARKRQEGDELLRSALARMPTDPSVHVDSILKEGEAARQIVEAAREWGADLVVMGSHGRGRLSALVQGSTTQDVIRDACCPVLVVSHEIPARCRPLK